MDFSGAIFSDHAKWEAERRDIPEDVIRQCLSRPSLVRNVRPGRVVVQREIAFGDPPRHYLLRIFVDIDRSPQKVVTVYRTSKIAKYTGAS
ncbi:MAG: DUF4258 domain-containing protein [Rhodospirillales bacterium]|jgi:hypothetical protein|nr:DUF4258 domain-containing protein [Rhodospirillales bacterium]